MQLETRVNPSPSSEWALISKLHLMTQTRQQCMNFLCFIFLFHVSVFRVSVFLCVVFLCFILNVSVLLKFAVEGAMGSWLQRGATRQFSALHHPTSFHGAVTAFLLKVPLNSGGQPLSCSFMVLSFDHLPQPHPRSSTGPDEASLPSPALVIVVCKHYRGISLS